MSRELEEQERPRPPRFGYYVRLRSSGLTIMARTKNEVRAAMHAIGSDWGWERIQVIPQSGELGVRLPHNGPAEELTR